MQGIGQQKGNTQSNINVVLPGVGVLGRAMVKYIDGEAKQGRYPLSGYM
jgi:NADH/NAD ratio-sensing transcriptional regulator Rex